MQPKVALCFIVSYRHVLYKEKMWRDWIRPNQDIINVYVHYAKKNLLQSDWLQHHAIPEKYTQPTSYYNVLPAYMGVLSYAYCDSAKNAWFCMLTESCVPILSPSQFREKFYEMYTTSILRCRPAYWNVYLHKRAGLQHLSKKYHLANDPWFTMTRIDVAYALLFMSNNNAVYKTICNNIGNESYFAVVNKTFHREHAIENSSSTIADWSRRSSPTSPYIFREDTLENRQKINELLEHNPHAMFLRKVAPECPDELIQHIIEMRLPSKAKQHASMILSVLLYLTIIVAGIWVVFIMV